MTRTLAVEWAQFGIRTVAVPEADQRDVQDAWARFRQMGRDAVSGRLPNVSTNHDLYLYGRKPS